MVLVTRHRDVRVVRQGLQRVQERSSQYVVESRFLGLSKILFMLHHGSCLVTAIVDETPCLSAFLSFSWWYPTEVQFEMEHKFSYSFLMSPLSLSSCKASSSVQWDGVGQTPTAQTASVQFIPCKEASRKQCIEALEISSQRQCTGRNDRLRRRPS